MPIGFCTTGSQSPKLLPFAKLAAPPDFLSSLPASIAFLLGDFLYFANARAEV